MDKPKNVVTLDRERTLQFDTNAFSLVEEKTGRNLAAADGFKALRIADIRAFLWAGLLHDDPELTIEQAGKLIAAKNIGAVSTAIAAGVNDFFAGKG